MHLKHYREYSTDQLIGMPRRRRPLAMHQGRRAKLPPTMRGRGREHACCGGVFRCTKCRKWVGWCRGCAHDDEDDPANWWCDDCWWAREKKLERRAA